MDLGPREGPQRQTLISCSLVVKLLKQQKYKKFNKAPKLFQRLLTLHRIFQYKP